MATCKYCGLIFVKNTANKKYCSSKCRSAYFRYKNPSKIKKYQKKYYKKFNVKCKECGTDIKSIKRNHGVTLCSDKCRKTRVNKLSKQRRKIASDAFIKYKESLGCSSCGYNEYGGSIDFHHTNPKNKRIRITAIHWMSQSCVIKKEIKKCVLLCKNCHYKEHSVLRECYV